jgi:hypothetical protein
MFEFRLFDFGFALAVPDKAATAPSLRRESVSVCSTLRDE